MTTLSNEKTAVVQRLYESSDAFRSVVDSALQTELNAVQARAAELSSVLGEAVEEGTPAAEPPRRRGRPTGSKNKAGAKKTNRSNGSSKPSTSTSTDGITHKEAISQVLSKADSEGLSSGEIYQKLSALKISGYVAPASSVLLTTLHGMRSKNQIKSKGSAPHLRYNLSK